MAVNPEPEVEGEPEAEALVSQNFIRKCFQNSPWLTISVLVHVLLITLLAIARPGREVPIQNIPISMASSMNLPPPVEVTPPVPDRQVPPDEQEGPVNLDPDYIPEAIAGRITEATEEVDWSKEAGEFNPDPDATWDKPSGATGGTAIGAGKEGHFGSVSPFSSRRLGGGGRGGGGGGQGGGGGRGGYKTEDAVNNALKWLRNHQSPDGHWDSAGFSAQCKGTPCDGPGSSAHDIGVTGLALLCFLGAGQTHQEGYYRETVKNGLKYLRSQQDEDGCIGQRIGQHFMYDHACAALAMAEAYGMTGERQFKEPAQKGITFILRAQNPYSAWRYAFPPDGDNDTSMTGWMIMALKSAKMSGLKIDEESFKSAMNFITEMTDEATGRTGYTERGSAPSRLNELMQLFPAEKSEALTAVGMLVRIFSDREADKDPMIDKGADLLAARVPVWEVGTGDIDFYYWYYGSLSMFQVGGTRWDKWNAALKTACLDHQRNKAEECLLGSWDAIDPWSGAGGRVYSTAVNCLSMEVYYRYDKVFGLPKKEAKKPEKPK